MAGPPMHSVPIPRGVNVRAATVPDRVAILKLVGAAFSDERHDGQEEVEIVDVTWCLEATTPELELVAVKGGAVVGHVMAAWGDLGGKQVAAVAPLAVAPTHQGQGIGTALMTDLLSRVEAEQLPLVVLLGSPGYYGRFGFEPAGPLGIIYRQVGADNPDFQVRRFPTYDPSYRGDFRYCWEQEAPH
jgi:putative acetyltransferase